VLLSAVTYNVLTVASQAPQKRGSSVQRGSEMLERAFEFGAEAKVRCGENHSLDVRVVELIVRDDLELACFGLNRTQPRQCC